MHTSRAEVIWHTSRAEVIWHTSRAEAFESYLMEFSKIFAARDGRFADVRDSADPSDPAGAAVDVALRIKGEDAPIGRSMCWNTWKTRRPTRF